MLKLREGEKVVCTHHLPEKGVKRGDIGLVETVTENNHYFISFSAFPFNMWTQNEVDLYLKKLNKF